MLTSFLVVNMSSSLDSLFSLGWPTYVASGLGAIALGIGVVRYIDIIRYVCVFYTPSVLLPIFVRKAVDLSFAHVVNAGVCPGSTLGSFWASKIHIWRA